MQRKILRWITMYIRRGNQRRVWKKIVQAMACVVVFCTTYALILPAITMEQRYSCGLEAHEHTAECYRNTSLAEVNCSLSHLGIHQHTADCYGADGLPVCGYGDFVLHIHESGCYDPRGNLGCPLEEIPEHIHGVDCYEDETVICGMQELLAHTHTEECRDENGSLVCGKPELSIHQHQEGCILYLSQQSELTCTLTEHTHDASCVSDAEADVETEEQWAAMAAQLELTDSWTENLLALSRSQLGYGESALNYQGTDEEARKGYTRYGAWYGTPYGDWDAMFVSFCLHYAGIPEEAIPYAANSTAWTLRLEELGLLSPISAYTPQPGELVFFEKYNGTAVHAGVLSGMDTETDAETGESRIVQFRVIAGDSDNRVAEVTVPAEELLSTCVMAAARQRWEELYPQPENLGEPDLEENELPPVSLGDTEPTDPQETTETTEPAVETDPTEATAAASSEEPAAVTVEQAETENYIVTVVYSSSLELPEGTELRVVEYAKDSDIFRQRCEEAGYELDWLLNIGFFLDDQELDLSGQFDVTVTSKQGQSLGNEIAHFTDEGVEQLTGMDATDCVEPGQTAVIFVAEGFSDFGGSIALAAEAPETTDASHTQDSVARSYSFTTVNPSNLQENTDYVIFTGSGNDYYYLGTYMVKVNDTDSHYLSIKGSGNPSYYHGVSWTEKASELTVTNPLDFTWQIVKENGQSYLVCKGTQQRLAFHNGWLELAGAGGSDTAITITRDGTGAIVGGNHKLRRDDQWRATWTNASNTYSTAPTRVYFARVTPAYGNYPHAVHTGEVNASRLRFYNLCESDGGIAPLAGCVFEVTGPNLAAPITITSKNEPEVHLPADIPDGTYTITELSAPDGYVRDERFQRSFTVENGKLVSDKNIGTFLNHSMEKLYAGKSAEVEDYNNRIYQILLNAKANMKRYELGPVDVLFVVDQSNSMLFPAGLEDTGKKVTLRKDGTNNIQNLEALNLDKSKMHYVIADPTGTSTVWCIWHNGETWMCQDASYYAKARHNNGEGYQDPNERAIFPINDDYSKQPTEQNGQTVRSNGCGLGKNLGSGSLGKYIGNNNWDSKSFTIYTSTDEYNRLHYLEEALASMIYELADSNSQNRVTLTRFSRWTDEEHCKGPLELTPANVDDLIDAVDSINTSGGTRQDRALEHIYSQHLNDPNDQYMDFDHTYTILITDGAPVRSGDDTPNSVGTKDDPSDKDGTTIYSRIKGHAEDVRSKSHLMTVALGMEDVEGGKEVLQQIATDGDHFCALDDASQLVKEMQDMLFETFRETGAIDFHGDIVDEISDSFYPIAWTDTGAVTDRRVLVQDTDKDWLLLQENDWITLDGRYTTAGAADAAGQLLKKEDGTFCVKWTNQQVSGADGWNGTIYVKAKEDFIGGNAIDTNKSAKVTVNGSDKTLETPTVNVRLLDMNQMNSEATVYLGDLVNSETDTPLDSLKSFYNDTRFAKLISGEGDVLNKLAEADGLEEAVFYLRYAMGRDLTDDEWATLASGQPITVAYTYDYASSHGPVGYFTFQLTQSGMPGANPSYHQHTATAACQPGGQPLTENCDAPAETYTLHVTYTAYKLNENGRPAQNVHNDTAGPGTQVGTGTTLENGLGVVDKDNVHEVHVISGKIEIIKHFEEGLTDEADRTFTFTLHRTEDGDDTSKDVTKTITIPAGQTQGAASITFDYLRRGTYTVSEAVDETYTVKEITVTDTTNCYHVLDDNGTIVTFVMGNNTENSNVIGLAAEGDRYTSYIDPVNGVYGAAVFTNKEIVYYGEVPVEKIWDDGAENHEYHEVYLVLYKDGVPMIDGDGNARLLRLDAANNWQGVFTVVLADKNDSVANYGFSVREVAAVDHTALNGWTSAILENDGETILYYDKALEQDRLLGVGGNGYIVQYDKTDSGVHTVTNLKSVSLPETGGMGTHLYTFSGLLVMLAGLMYYGCSQRRKRERRADR